MSKLSPAQIRLLHAINAGASLVGFHVDRTLNPLWDAGLLCGGPRITRTGRYIPGDYRLTPKGQRMWCLAVLEDVQ